MGSGGHEQSGRRPAIVVQDDTAASALPLTVVVPLTTALSTARFGFCVEIPATPENGLRITSNALVFQIRAIDRRAVSERMGAITDEQLKAIHDQLDKLLGRFQDTANQSEVRS